MQIDNLKSKIQNLKSKIPALALAALVIILGVWWLERDASLRREGALKELQRQTAAEVAALRARADAAVRDAKQSNARAASELEASRQLLARQSQDLRQKLDALQAAEKTRVAQVAVLPASEIVKRLGEQLGPGEIESLKEKESGVRSQESEETKSESRNQKAEENRPSSVVSSPLSVVGSQLPVATRDGQRTTDDGPSSIANHQSEIANSPNSGALYLTESGARKVETAFVELASCRERSGLQAQQLDTCEKEGAAERVMVEQQKSSIAELNQALADKDQILAKRESEFKAEMKVARGTWLSRASRTALHVAIGVGIGLVIR